VCGVLGGLICSMGATAMPEGGKGEAVIHGEASEGRRYLVDASRCGDRLSTEWRDLEGSVVAYEEVELSGGRWVRYRLQRTNIGQDLRAERRGDVVTITDRSRPGRSPAQVNGRGDLVAGPQLVFFLQSRLADLRAGRRIELQYLLADRGTALGFIARGESVGTGTRVALEASAALARPFVPTTTFEFGADGGLRQVSGRMLPVTGDAKSPKALDGVLRMNAAQSSCNRKSLT
jgi:hypothetical protein